LKKTTTEIRDYAIVRQLVYSHSAATIEAIDEHVATVNLDPIAADVATTVEELAARVAIKYAGARMIIRFAARLLPSKWRAVVNQFLDEVDALAMKVNPDFKAGKDV
jgi:hypothetical protein